jgi:prepilin-type N-terminal cleavage/methylation domain-containing protein
MKSRSRSRHGFTLIEVSVAMVLILLVATTAAASLRVSMATVTGTQTASQSAAVIRQFREFTFEDTIEALDARDNQTYDPVLGNGELMPDTEGFTLQVDVTPVDDYDPSTVVAAEDSRTRQVTVSAWFDGRQTLEAVWLATDH